jgi:hypothetical protein
MSERSVRPEKFDFKYSARILKWEFQDISCRTCDGYTSGFFGKVSAV